MVTIKFTDDFYSDANKDLNKKAFKALKVSRKGNLIELSINENGKKVYYYLQLDKARELASFINARLNEKKKNICPF